MNSKLVAFITKFIRRAQPLTHIRFRNWQRIRKSAWLICLTADLPRRLATYLVHSRVTADKCQLPQVLVQASRIQVPGKFVSSAPDKTHQKKGSLERELLAGICGSDSVIQTLHNSVTIFMTSLENK